MRGVCVGNEYVSHRRQTHCQDGDINRWMVCETSCCLVVPGRWYRIFTVNHFIACGACFDISDEVGD